MFLTFGETSPTQGKAMCNSTSLYAADVLHSAIMQGLLTYYMHDSVQLHNHFIFSVYMYVYMDIHTYIHTYIRTRARTHTHTKGLMPCNTASGACPDTDRHRSVRPRYLYTLHTSYSNRGILATPPRVIPDTDTHLVHLAPGHR